MRVTGTERAAEIVRRMGDRRDGTLSITIGTGCCESTAPFLYEDHYAGFDAEQVGEVAGVPVLAPAMLRNLYADDDELIIDVVDELAESMSIETELGVRLAFRSPDQIAASLAACEVPSGDASTGAPDVVVTEPSRATELPDHLARIRIR